MEASLVAAHTAMQAKSQNAPLSCSHFEIMYIIQISLTENLESILQRLGVINSVNLLIVKLHLGASEHLSVET